MCSSYPIVKDDKTGTPYRPVAGPSIKDEGQRTIMVDTGGKKDARTLKFRICNVHKPLVSVADMVDNDQTVVFSKTQSFAKHNKTGLITPFVRRKKVFEIDCIVRPAPKTGELEKNMISMSSLEQDAMEIFLSVQSELEDYRRMDRTP